MSACHLPEYEACCCTCKHRATDYEHCTTTKLDRVIGSDCFCSIPKGFVCTVGFHIDPINGKVHSGWSEHGLCELHEEKVK